MISMAGQTTVTKAQGQAMTVDKATTRHQNSQRSVHANCASRQPCAVQDDAESQLEIGG